ncbi:uncharacterized protein LOC132639701 [Lycium barbarum]|uniref:uncharacterized protein LOC132639701 n=1 Tax=Lycium barbarum TaxID=112863 RepID=UPI00293F6252|nr:uncharacterized protein LOC132639701 [Lycium barbarum]
MEDRIGGSAITLTEVQDFQTCIDLCGLAELPRTGSKYTWNDNHDGNRIFSKIDWAFANGEWLDTAPTCKVHYLPEGVSDHNPAHVTLVNSKPKQRRAFKYYNAWSTHPDFMGIVQEEWQTHIEGCKMYQVISKLKLLKHKLRRLHSNHFSNLLNEVDKDRAHLKEAQEKLQLDPLNDHLQQEERELSRKFKRSSYLAEMMLMQRSKATWLKLGDDNTKYFHSVIKQRRLGQTIFQLKDENQRIQHDPEEIAGIFVRFYKHMLGETGGYTQKAVPGFLANGHTLTIEQQVTLLGTYSRKEVKEAMFSINPNKSPGPDGYGSGFFREAWSIIGDDITDAVLEVIDSGSMLKQLNATAITLIPKVNSPDNAGQFRPIACCNVVYKCVSKVICQRLKHVLPF